MTFEQTRLTTLEEVKSLVDAGIDPNIDNWDDETLSRAAEVLDMAQRKKLERLSAGAVCQCGHKRNGHSRFIGGLFTGCQSCDCQSFEWPN